MSQSRYLLCLVAVFLIAIGITDIQNPALQAADDQPTTEERWQAFFRAPPPTVAPVITYPASRDMNGDRITDDLEPLLVAALSPRPVKIVMKLYTEPRPEDVIKFEALGGTVRSVWRHALYAIRGTIPSDRLEDLADAFESKLCVIRSEDQGSGQPDLDNATEIVGVRNRVVGYTGDANGSIAILDSGLGAQHNHIADPDSDNQLNDPDDWWDACGTGTWDGSYHAVGWWDRYGIYDNPMDPDTNISHGTAVAGCAAGEGSLVPAWQGIAPTSHLVGVRIWQDGNITPDNAIGGINTVIANRQCAKIKVANLSLSYKVTDPTDLMDAVTNAVANGIVFVCSAGNGWDNGPGYDYYEVMYPGRNMKAITVGATNDADSIAGYSSHGPTGSAKPDLVAPGGSYWKSNGGIHTTDNYCPVSDCGSGNQYDQFREVRGTSYSAPIVAGAASLVIDAWERANDVSWNWTQAQVLFIKGVLLMTAVEINEVGEDPDGSQPANSPGTKDRGDHDLVEGYGRLNVDAAVEAVTKSLYSAEVGTDSFGPNSTDKKVWVRKIAPCQYLRAYLTVPPGADYDLYLYEKDPDANGIPIIEQKSVSASTGTDEYVELSFGQGSGSTYRECGGAEDFFLVVKWVEGSGEFRVHFLDYIQPSIDNATALLGGSPGSGRIVSWIDFDSDPIHTEDLLLSNTNSTLKLYSNDGDGNFTEVATLVGPGPIRAVTWGDYDGDGDPDLYVAGGSSFGTTETLRNRLYRNDGGAVFTDMGGTPLGTSIGSVKITGDVSWIDFDEDGDLDLYLGMDDVPAIPPYISPNILYENTGSSSLSSWYDVAVAAGVADSARTRAAVWADYDNDGDPDLYTANYEAGSNHLYKNSGGIFSDATKNGVESDGDCHDAVWGDFDNDGDMDLYVVRGDALDAGANQFFQNQGTGTLEWYLLAQLTWPALVLEGNSIAVAAGDYENDGDLDIFVAQDGDGNVRLQNIDGYYWAVDATIPNLYGSDAGWGVGLADMNFDNYRLLDCAFANAGADNELYEAYYDDRPVTTASVPARAAAQLTGSGNWYYVRPVGSGNNKSAIGARVEVTAGGVTQIREVESYSGNSPTLEFGLGTAVNIDSVVVSWPSGARTSQMDIHPNWLLVIEEGDTIPTGIRDIAAVPMASVLHQNYPNPFNPSTTIVYEMSKAAEVSLRVYDVRGRFVREIVSEYKTAGIHRVAWNGTNSAGARVASGVYFYRMVAGEYTSTRRLVLLK